jgi:hypothetical protein
MLTMSKRLARAAALTALLLPALACGDSPTAPPGIQPQITNNTDDFAYQISDLSTVTGTWDYTWQNTGTLAKISHASDAGAGGTATVTVLDADGTQVYSGALATSGEPLSSPAGVAGAWTIRVTFSSYSNTQVNFRVTTQ